MDIKMDNDTIAKIAEAFAKGHESHEPLLYLTQILFALLQELQGLRSDINARWKELK